MHLVEVSGNAIDLLPQQDKKQMEFPADVEKRLSLLAAAVDELAKFGRFSYDSSRREHGLTCE